MYCNFTPSTIDISLNQQRGNSVFDTKRWWVGGERERERKHIKCEEWFIMREKGTDLNIWNMHVCIIKIRTKSHGFSM